MEVISTGEVNGKVLDTIELLGLGKRSKNERGTLVIQPNPKLYDKHSFVWANGVVQVELQVPFRILV